MFAQTVHFIGYTSWNAATIHQWWDRTDINADLSKNGLLGLCIGLLVDFDAITT